MKALLKAEYRKIVRSWPFWVTLAVAMGVALFAATASIRSYQAAAAMERQVAAYDPNTLRNPQNEIQTLFNEWVGQDFSSAGASLFFLMLPLFAACPYAWSYLSERKSGYEKNMLTRTTRQRYFLAKYIAVFLSGAFVVVVPMVVNLMTVAAFVPAVSPDVQYDIYYAMPPTAMASRLFYAHPWGFVAFRLFTAALFGGLLAGSVVALSFFVRNRYAALLIPFLTLVVINYVSSALMEALGFSFSLNYIICGTYGDQARGWVVAAYAVLLAVFSFGVTMRRGLRDEVF